MVIQLDKTKGLLIGMILEINNRIGFIVREVLPDKKAKVNIYGPFRGYGIAKDTIMKSGAGRLRLAGRVRCTRKKDGIGKI